ncbi:MAG: hypothetical protein ACRC46_05960 [Thermoguttaceae bacterium]
MNCLRSIVRCVGLFLAIVVMFLSVTLAQAGMSSVSLTDYGVQRLVNLSTAIFFGMVVATLLVRLSWGRIVADTDLPKPTLVKSLAVTFLGGLLFFLVLVMIAGSRELFSPGAWLPDGILYRLAPNPAAEPADKEVNNE